jgi:hypothetical protein
VAHPPSRRSMMILTGYTLKRQELLTATECPDLLL